VVLSFIELVRIPDDEQRTKSINPVILITTSKLTHGMNRINTSETGSFGSLKCTTMAKKKTVSVLVKH
jgi:hypothetical protein